MPPKSNLWQHYTRNPDQSGPCRHCGKIVKTKGNTSNLKCHLQSKHPKVFEVYSKSLKVEGQSQKIGKLTAEFGSTNSSEVGPNIQNEKASTSTPSSSAENNSSSKGSNKSFQHTILDALKKIESFKEGGSLNQKLIQAIIYMICKDCQPLSIVEHTRFCKLIKTMTPHFKIPSRFTVKRMINDTYEVIRDVMKKSTLTIHI